MLGDDLLWPCQYTLEQTYISICDNCGSVDVVKTIGRNCKRMSKNAVLNSESD